MAALPPTALDRLVCYRRTDNIELVPLTSPTTAVGAGSTTIATGIALGFTFRFDGVGYTTCALSPRGFLRLAGSVTSGTNSNLFASNTSQVIAPWWDSLETADSVGYIKHEVQGVAPFRRFVAEWYVNLSDTYTVTDALRAKFQCILFETKDKAELRYGAVETVGSPANTSSGSIGLKGDTSSTTDNYRDLAVNDLELGGSKTTTTNLRAYVPGEWPGGRYRIVFEPAYPMCGLYIDEPIDELTGILAPEDDYWWRLANNVNWLYCNHCPALINFSPWAADDPDDPRYITPITPSADDIDYDFWVVGKAEPAASVGISVDRASVTDPGFADGPWTLIQTMVDTADGDGLVEDTMSQTVLAAWTYLRWRWVASDPSVPFSMMMAPKPITEFDPATVLASGFRWMSIAQIRAEGAPVHPEFLNRAWLNCAYVLADRKQCLWSFGTCDDSDTSFDFASTDLEVRTAGKSACSMLGWPGQYVTVQLVAFDTGSPGKAVFGQDGGQSVSFALTDADTTYRLQTDSLQLSIDQPTLTLTADPVGTMRIAWASAQWAPQLSTDLLIRGTTPPARFSDLSALADRVQRCCLYATSMTGLATHLKNGSSGYVHCAWMIPAATRSMRPKLMRHDGATKGGAALPTSLFGASSGATADDEIVIPNPHTTGRDAYPPDGGSILSVTGARVFEPLPSAPMDRMLESPTTSAWGPPEREEVRARGGVGITLIPLSDDPSAN